MLELAGIKNAALRAAIKPREEDPIDKQADFSQYIPNYRLKGRKMRTTSLSDCPQSLPNQRIIKLKEFKTKHNNLWDVSEYLLKDTANPMKTEKSFSNNNETQQALSLIKGPAKFTSANLPNKMNDYLNELVIGYGSSQPRPPSSSRNPRSTSSQSIRQAIHKKKMESNCSYFFKKMRKAVNRTYRRSELYQNHTMPLIETNYIQKMKESNDMVKRASRLPQRETRPTELKLIQKASPNKYYRKKPKSREDPDRHSMAQDSR